MAFKSTMLFDVLGNILQKKSMKLYKEHIAAEDFAAASRFMVLRYLSMCSNPQVRDIVLDNYITLERMPEKIVYLWLLCKIPKQNSSFIKYLR